MKKSNDWLVAGINNPDFTVQDFADAGLDKGNTQFLSKDDYLKSDFIKDKFTDENGKFKQNEFDNFYNKKAQEFQAFQDSQQEFRYDWFDTSRKPGDKVKSPGFALYTVANPDRINTGVGARNELGQRKMSRMELAQTQKIFDPATGKYEDKSVNDNALTNDIIGWVKSLFDEPLIIAQWEDDGDHYDPFTRQTVHHKKGDYKLNENGTYYTERLNGRSPLNKEVVSAFDYLTVDGVGVNKYDFFDSDDLEKSIGGTIMKSAASIAPMFLTGPVGAVYGGVMVAKEFSKTIPMLYGMMGAWFNADTPKWMNNLAGYGMTLTQSQSESSKGSMWNFEQMANLITDVALQWGQQKAIAQACNYFNKEAKGVNIAYNKARQFYINSSMSLLDDPNINASNFSKITGVSEEIFKKARSLSGTDPERFINLEGLKSIFEEIGKIANSEKWMETSLGSSAITKFVKPAEKLAQEASKFGQDLSLVYMSIISNTDVYQELLDQGLSKKEAAAVALASCIGMFGIDKTGLGEVFFDEATRDDTIRAFNAVRRESKGWKDFIKQINKDVTEKELSSNKIKKLFNSALDFSKKHTNDWWHDVKYHTGGFIGKSIAEGVEEVGEDFASDCAKYIYELAGDIGFDTTKKDIGAFENASERYLQSFVGGSLGGGLFYGIDVYKTGFRRRDLDQEISYLIRNGQKNELLHELEKAHKEGKLGNTTLSATETTEVTDEDGSKKTVFLTAKDGESLNDFVYNKIKETIELQDAIINENQIGLDEEQLFNQMIMSDLRLKKLGELLEKETGKSLKDLSYQTGYQQYFQTICSELIDAETQLQDANRTLDGLPTGKKENDEVLRNQQIANPSLYQIKQNNLARLQEKIDKLKQQKDDFLTGKMSLDYTRMLKFGLDERINSPYFTGNFRQYVKLTLNKDLEDLSKSEYETLSKEWEEKKKSPDFKFKLNQAWLSYKLDEETYLNDVIALQQEQKDMKASDDIIEEFFGEKGPLMNLAFFDKRVHTFDYERLPEYSGLNDIEIAKAINALTPEEYFAKFGKNREEEIEKSLAENWKNLNLAISDLKAKLGGKLDLTTRERLRMLVQKRLKDANIALNDIEDQSFLINDTPYIPLAGSLDLIKKTISEGFRQGKSADEIKQDVKKLYNENKIEDDVEQAKIIAFDLTNTLSAYDDSLTLQQRITLYIDDLKTRVYNQLKTNRYLIQFVNELDAGVELNDEIKNIIYDYLISKNSPKEAIENSNELRSLLETYLTTLYTSEGKVEEVEEDCNKIIEEVNHKLEGLDYSIEDKLIDNLGKGVKKGIETEISDKLDDIDVVFDEERGTFDILKYRLSTDNSDSVVSTTTGELLMSAYRGDEGALNDIEELLNIDDEIDFDLFIIDNVNDYIDSRENTIQNNDMIKAIKNLNDSFKGDKSPALKLLERYHLKINGENVIITDLIEKLVKRFEEADSRSDFQFTKEELEAMDYIEDMVKRLQSVIWAASTQSDLINPTGHNSEVNLFVKNHSGSFDGFEELPVLDPDVALSIIKDTRLLLMTIGIKDSDGRYNVGSWRSLGEINYADKVVQFTKALKKWNKNLYKFLSDFHKTWSVFKGFTNVPEVTENDTDAELHISQLFDFLRKNILEEIKDKRINLEDYLENLLKYDFDFEKLEKQKVSLIDQNLGELSDYDKFMILGTVLSMQDSEFKKFLKEIASNEDNIVPLTILNWATQLVIALKNNSKIFKALVNIVQKRNPKLKYFDSIAFLSGNGGAGKTQVCARHIVEWTKLFLTKKGVSTEDIPNRIWLTAPKTTQQNNLKDACRIGTTIDLIHNSDNTALFDRLFTDKDALQKILEGLKTHTDNDYITFKEVQKDIWHSELTDKTISAIKADPDNAPSQIVIDEATNLPIALIECLNIYAQKNRTDDNKLSILCIGDDKQIGNSQDGLNFDPYRVFCLRTNPLGITLRDSNSQQAHNVQITSEALLQFTYADDNATAGNKLKNDFKNISLKAYLGTELNGTIIRKELTDDIIEKIPKLNDKGEKTSIIYIGSQDDNFRKLQSNGYNVTAYSLEEVQGLEADYCICKGIDNFEYVTDIKSFYTALTRGKVGSIFISDTLQENFSTPTMDNYQAFAPSIKEAINTFKEPYLKQLDKIIDQMSEDTLSNFVSEEPKSSFTSKMKDFTKSKSTEESEEEISEEDTFEEEEETTEKESEEETEEKITEESTEEKESTEEEKTEEDELVPLPEIDEVKDTVDALSSVLSFTENMFSLDEKQKTRINNYLKALKTIPSRRKDFENFKNKLGNILKFLKKFEGKEINLPKIDESLVLSAKNNPAVNGDEKFALDKLISLYNTLNKELNEKDNFLEKLEIAGAIYPTVKEINKKSAELADKESETIEEESEKDSEIVVDDPKNNDNDEDEELNEIKSKTESSIDTNEYDGIAYSGMMLTGLQYDKNKHVYTNPREGGNVYEDMQVFLDDNSDYKVRDGETLNDALTKAELNLRYMRDLIAYNHMDNITTNEFFDKVKEALGDKFLEECHKDIKYYVERVETSKLNLAYGVGGEIKPTTGEMYSYVLYAEIPLKFGKVWKLSLGLLSSPEHEVETLERRKESLNKYLDKLPKKTDGENPELTKERDKINRLINGELKSQLDHYNNFLSKLTKDRPKILVDITSEGRTWLRHMKGSKLMRFGVIGTRVIDDLNRKIEYWENESKNSSSSTKKELANKIIKTLQDRINRIKEFHEKSYQKQVRFATFSDPYVLTKNKSALKNEALRGRRAIAFCTMDSTISQEQLLDLYNQLMKVAEESINKNGFNAFGDEYKGVTMIALNNLGLDIRDLVDPELQGCFAQSDKYGFKPYKSSYEGIRLYISLWNFRANLLIFRTNVDQALSAWNNQDGVQKYSWNELQEELYKEAEYEEAKKKGMSAKKLHNEELIKFINDQLSKSNTVQFRLGGSYNGNGFYIREISMKNPKTYYPHVKDGHINGTYIDLETTDKFLSLLGGYDVKTGKSTDQGIFGCFNNILTLDGYSPMLRLSLDPNKAKNLVNKIVQSAKDDTDVIMEEEIENADGTKEIKLYKLKFESFAKVNKDTGNIATYIPAILYEIMKKSTKMIDVFLTDNTLTTTDVLDGINLNSMDDLLYARQFDIKYIDKDGNEKSFGIFKSIAKPLIEYMKHVSKNKRTKYDSNYNWGLAPLDMLGLALHGTTECIYEKELSSPVLGETTDKSAPIKKDSAAMFPQGIFVDPVAEETDEYKASGFKKIIVSKWLFGSDVYPSSPIIHFKEHVETEKTSDEIIDEAKEEISNIPENNNEEFGVVANKVIRVRDEDSGERIELNTYDIEANLIRENKNLDSSFKSAGNNKLTKLEYNEDTDSGNYYLATFEDGSKIKYRKDVNDDIIIDKNGTTYGSTVNSNNKVEDNSFEGLKSIIYNDLNTIYNNVSAEEGDEEESEAAYRLSTLINSIEEGKILDFKSLKDNLNVIIKAFENDRKDATKLKDILEKIPTEDSNLRCK